MMLTAMLLIVATSTMVTSMPVAQTQCVKPNAYTWELYSILVSKSQDTTVCERSFARQSYNPLYCSSNYIHVLNILQKNYPPRTPAGTSGSGVQPETVTSKSCYFDATFTLSKGDIIGGDIALYKHTSASDRFEVVVYNKLKDDFAIIGSSTIENKGKGWNRIEINEFSTTLGNSKHEVQLSVQFIKNGDEISCQEAQNTFVTDCNKGYINPRGPPFNHAPGLVLISKGHSFLLEQHNREHNRATRTASDDRDSKCALQTKKLSLPSANYNGQVTTTQVDIGQCFNTLQDTECVPKQTKDLLHITKEKDTIAIATISSIVKC